MDTKFKIFFGLVLCALLVLSAYGYNYQTIYNPFTTKLDYTITGNFSGNDIDLDNYNLTTVDCIIFNSGGQICDSP